MKRLEQRIRPPHYGPETSSQVKPLESSSAATTIVAICIGSAFFILVIAATTCYLYKRRNSEHFGHKTLLIKRNSPAAERPVSIRKSSAVKSPGSATLLKKSPSPTGQKSPPGDNGIRSEKTSPNNETVKEVTVEIEQTQISNTMGQQVSKLDYSDKENSGHTENELSLGKLHFKLKYNYEKRALCVTVIRCTDLPPKETNSASCDPYIKLQLLPEKLHRVKTRVMRKTQNPIYDEDFTFFGINSNQLQTTVLHFVVLSFDRYSRDEVIGEVFCQLNLLEFDSLEKQIMLSREICPRSHKLRLQGRGEVLVSLCYQPAANRLTVVILKARNLPKMDLTDPYVKIYLLYNNQKITKKRTHVKKRTTNPVFNESFVFDVPYNEGLENVSLEFQVFDYDRVTKDEVIGKLQLGPKTGAATQKHWQDVISSPRRQIAEWHKLKD